MAQSLGVDNMQVERQRLECFETDRVYTNKGEIMKVKGKQLETMRAAFTATVGKYGAEAIKADYAKLTTKRMLWDCWWASWRAIGRPDVYANGVNDNHIETVLKQLGKECGLV